MPETNSTSNKGVGVWNETRRLFVDIISAADNAQHVLQRPDSARLASPYVQAIEKRLAIIKQQLADGGANP